MKVQLDLKLEELNWLKSLLEDDLCLRNDTLGFNCDEEEVLESAREGIRLSTRILRELLK